MANRGDNIKNSKGFSLVEIIVSIGLIGIFMVPVSLMMLSAISFNNSSQHDYERTLIIQDIIEEEKVSDNTLSYELNKSDYLFKVNIQKLTLDFLTDHASDDVVEYDLDSNQVYRISIDILHNGKSIDQFIGFKEIQNNEAN